MSQCCINTLLCMGILCLDDWQYCWFEKRPNWEIIWIKCTDAWNCWAVWQVQCWHEPWECNWCNPWLYNYDWVCVEECPPWYIPDNCGNCVATTTWCWSEWQPPCINWCWDWLYDYNWICVRQCPNWYSPNAQWVCVTSNKAPKKPSTYRWESATYSIPITGWTVLNDPILFLIINPFVDPEGHPITYTVSNLPIWLVRDAGNQKITGTLSTVWTYEASIKACDSLWACSAVYPLFIKVV